MARLLIVDDVPDNVALLASCLEPAGHQIVSAHDGVTALRLAAEAPPDLVLVDLMMPGLDGIEVAQLLHRRPATRGVPVILVTARGEAGERLRALEAGVHEVLTKPVEPVELSARVGSLLRLKLLHDELLRTREELLRRENLAAIGTLVAGVAHEINSPLASALSFLEMMKEQLDAGGPARDLAFVIEQLERVKNLVQGLLGLSRQTSSFEEEVSLEKVAQDVLRTLGPQMRKTGVQAELDATPPVPTLRGNFAQLAQVAMNLLNNAAQAVPPGNGLVRIQVGEANGEGYLRVEDNGPGVPEPLLRDIFKPFFTTKGPGQGTGLGLYACQMIADKHGGRIEVGKSKLGGASFTLWVPRR